MKQYEIPRQKLLRQNDSIYKLRDTYDSINYKYTGVFLPSRHFFKEKQSYVLTESPLSKYAGGQPLLPFYLADKVKVNFNAF